MATEKWLVGYNTITFESFIRHITKHREPYDQYDMGYTDAVDNIESWLDANKVEVVEIVRCKDCVYCSTKRGKRYNQLLRFCEWGDGYEKVDSNGSFFCAHGKRIAND